MRAHIPRQTVRVCSCGDWAMVAALREAAMSKGDSDRPTIDANGFCAVEVDGRFGGRLRAECDVTFELRDLKTWQSQRLPVTA